MQSIIGRVDEQNRLMKRYTSDRSEFVAVYGRRRVGKTFLIKSLFGAEFTFYASGLQNEDMARQLENFNDEIVNFGGSTMTPAANWHSAFDNLQKLVASSPRKGKKVVFLDEISWMGAQDASFISALDHFWNRWISSRHDVLLIVCGSATSWIVDKIVNNTGGLHNRLTEQIHLAPFTLKECEDYFRERGISLPRYHILESYMVFGGIPFYLDFFEADRSLAQNIDRIYFAPNAPLMNEYDNLFRSLFHNAENYIRVIEALSEIKKGLSREDLADRATVKSGGTLTKVLADLVSCGFVQEYRAFGKKKRDRMYQLIDPFTLFHLAFSDKQHRFTENYWIHYSATPAHAAWSGYAFELVCLLHISQIRQALGIGGVLTEASSWRGKKEGAGAQIDLVIDRADRIIHLCEMKFASDVYTIDKAYSARLRERKTAFLSETGTRKAAHTTLVTTYGLARNEYSAEVLFQLTMDALFS